MDKKMEGVPLTGGPGDPSVRTELLPCPFCGRLPRVITEFNRTLIYCYSSDCYIHPFVDSYSSAELLQAEEMWNRRMKIPCS